MKKIVLAAICAIGFQSASFAQEEIVEMTSSSVATDSVTSCKKGKLDIYASFGAAMFTDFKINDKLRSAGVPRLPDAMPEFSVGFNTTFEKSLFDFEVNANYSDEKNTGTRVRAGGIGVKVRWQYIPFRTKSFFAAGGADVSWFATQADIYSRGNTIDMNNLDPSTHSGHISLNNEQLMLGPSVALGFFQNKSFPIRLNLGYEWGITNGKWKSDFADVNNAVKESGLGRAYAKVTIGL